MCGICFSSFSPTSSVNIREIARTLLVAVENRGPQATGVAWIDPADNTSVRGFNCAITASKFVADKSFRRFDDTARTFIGHTRFATKGSLDNHLNNHPVYAYAERGEVIAAVHNGGVWNDDESFAAHRLTRFGQVDSEIIPAMIARYGSDAGTVSSIFGELEGGIATAWLDERAPGTLHCVRAADSPMAVMTLNLDTPAGRIDGVVGASTESALLQVLTMLNLDPTAEGISFYAIGEGEFFTVTDGVWDLHVTPFELPDFATMYGGNWRRKNASTQRTSSSASAMVDQAWRDEMDEHGGMLSLEGYSASYDPATGTTTYLPTDSWSGRAAVLEDVATDTAEPADEDWWARESLKSDLVQLGVRLDEKDYTLTNRDRVLIDMALDYNIDIEEMFGLPSEALDGSDPRVVDGEVISDTSEGGSWWRDSATAGSDDTPGDTDGMGAVSDAALAVVSKVVAGTGWPSDRPVEDVAGGRDLSLV